VGQWGGSVDSEDFPRTDAAVVSWETAGSSFPWDGAGSGCLSENHLREAGTRNGTAERSPRSSKPPVRTWRAGRRTEVPRLPVPGEPSLRRWVPGTVSIWSLASLSPWLSF
jgi:hypothetical protein